MLDIARIDTAQNRDRLSKLEIQIEGGLRMCGIVAQALTEIQDTRLYLLTHHSWREYVTERWGHGKAWANKLIAAQAAIALPLMEPKSGAKAATDERSPPAEKAPEDRQDRQSGVQVAPQAPLVTQTPQTTQSTKPESVEAVPVEAPSVKLPDDCTIAPTYATATVIAEGIDVFGQIKRDIHAIRRRIIALGEEEIGRYVPRAALAKDAKDLAANLEQSRPYAPCPFCRQGKVSRKCEVCGGAHWIAKQKWQVSAPELR